MQWGASSEKDNTTESLEKNLWDATDQFRANSGLKYQEYSSPVLGLIFLRFAEVRFHAQRALFKKNSSSHRGSRVDEPAAYHAEGILNFPAGSQFEFFINRHGGASTGEIINSAMRDIETHNPQLAGRPAQDLQHLHQHMKPESLLAMTGTVPDRKTVEQITKFVAPMLTMCEQHRTKIQNLR